MQSLGRHFLTGRSIQFGAFLFLLLGITATASAQMTPDQAADLLLNAARRAYNERNYPFATTKFREFLQRFGGHKDANSARYGLALCLLEGPDKNFTEAIQNLQPLAGNKALADYPHVLYYMGHCQRGLGIRELAQAAAKPQEALQRRAEANRRFEEAVRSYAGAV